jgi:hypothetical protein
MQPMDGVDDHQHEHDGHVDEEVTHGTITQAENA